MLLIVLVFVVVLLSLVLDLGNDTTGERLAVVEDRPCETAGCDAMVESDEIVVARLMIETIAVSKVPVSRDRGNKLWVCLVFVSLPVARNGRIGVPVGMGSRVDVPLGLYDERLALFNGCFPCLEANIEEHTMRVGTLPALRWLT